MKALCCALAMLAACPPAYALADDGSNTMPAPGPAHRWKLRVWDAGHRLRTDATLRFTGNAASESCMAGTWKRMAVESVQIADREFLPLNEPLAYTVQQGELVIGRTAVCDGYLFLVGKPDRQRISGNYRQTGLGYSRILGSFELNKIP